MACVNLPPIDIDTFVEQEIERVRRFGEMWKKQAAENPEQWPMVMAPGDWDEQLMADNGISL